MTNIPRTPRLVRGVEITTEQDMWQQSKHYRFRSGMYYGRIRYVELRDVERWNPLPSRRS